MGHEYRTGVIHGSVAFKVDPDNREKPVLAKRITNI